MSNDPHNHDHDHDHDHAHGHDHDHAHGHAHHDDEHDQGTQAMVRTLRFGFASLLVVWVGLLIIYLCSGPFILEDNEEAYLLRFGEVVRDNTGKPKIYASGKWHFAFPSPIDREVRVETKKTHTVATQSFLSKSTANIMSGEEEAAPDDPTANLTVGQDYYGLTGDTNIVHGEWSLEYTVSDPYLYENNFASSPSPSAKRENAELYGMNDVIRGVLDNAILKAYAHATLEDALYSGADRLREEVHQEVNAKVDALNLGITVTTVNYNTKTPPKPTKAAFDAVVQAEQERGTERLRAQQYADERLPLARQEASRVISEAQTYKNSIESRTRADAAYFRQLVDEMDKADSKDAVLVGLYNKTLASLIGNSESIYVLKPGQQIRIMLNPSIKKKPAPGDQPPQP